MAQNITIANATYSAVPAIDVPKQGGGTARYVDTAETAFVITISWDSDEGMWLPDCTFAQVQTAYSAGRQIVIEADPNEAIEDVQVSGLYYPTYYAYTVTSATISGDKHTLYLFNGNGVTVDDEWEFYDAPTGNINITQTGVTDVTNYATATVASGSATPPTTISGSQATLTTGTNTITLQKTLSVTPQVSAGYVSAGTAGNVLVNLNANVTTKAATTYHPSSSQQTIASGTYLTGTQTINAVTTTNLTAANIKNGVVVQVGDSSDPDSVTSITGTYSGGGGADWEVDTKTITASNYPVSISFTSMKGEPKAFFLRSTSQISSSGSTTYYYIIAMRYNGSSTTGSCFRIGSTRRVDPVASGYSWSYSGTTLTITSSAGSRSASPGAFNNGYELTYFY